MYQKKREIAIKTSEQMAVYDAKLTKPEGIKRENLKKIYIVQHRVKR